MFDFHILGQGGDINPQMELNGDNTLLLLFLFTVGVLIVIRYPALRKWGLKVLGAVVFIYGGYILGMYIGVEVVHSVEHWNVFAVLGLLAGIAAFLYLTKVINDRYKR